MVAEAHVVKDHSVNHVQSDPEPPAGEKDPFLSHEDHERLSTLPGAPVGVGMWGALVLCVNTMNGPGLLAIPEVYQSAGWLFPTMCLILVALVAGSTGQLVEAAMELARNLPDRNFPAPTRSCGRSDRGSPCNSPAGSPRSSMRQTVHSPRASPQSRVSIGSRPERFSPSPSPSPNQSPPGTPGRHARLMVDDEEPSPRRAGSHFRGASREEPNGRRLYKAPSQGSWRIPGSPSRRSHAGASRVTGLSHRSGTVFTLATVVTTRFEEIREAPEETLEFASLVGLYFGKKAEKVTTVLLSMCLLTLGLAQMVIGCQVLDSFFIFAFGKSYALQYAGSGAGWVHSDTLSLTPFGSGFWGISLGFLAVFIFCMILGRMDLSANIGPQIASFLLFITSAGIFYWHFASTEYDPLEPSRLLVVDKSGLAGFLGVVVFNYSFVISVPSLVNEKRPGVHMGPVVWSGTGLMTCIYVAMGILGGMAFRVNHNDVLSDLLYPATPTITKLAVFGYTHAIVPAIPIYCILLQYNMEQQNVTRGLKAYLLCNLIPWMIVMIFMYQPAFTSFVNWTSLLVNGFVNFSIPLAVYMKAAYVAQHGWPSSARQWLAWAYRTTASRADVKVAQATVALSFITFLLLFTIGVNLVYVIALGEDLVSSSQPAVAGHGSAVLAPADRHRH